MSVQSKIRTSADISVFARNHEAYLEAVVARNLKQPLATTVFRGGSLWAGADQATKLWGPIQIYFAPIGGDGNIRYEAKLVFVKLYPNMRDEETRRLLRSSLKETKNEGLWEKGKKRVHTLYLINRCHKLDVPFPMTRLIKLSDERPISKDFGYSYSLVYRPQTTDLLNTPDEIEDGQDLYEGASRQVWVNAYERNPKARKKCIDHYGHTCSVCGFDFEKEYGWIGREYIHVHHLRALSDIDARYKVDPIKDLRPICPIVM
ncbi:MAG TPA: hypothetical protein VFD48_17210 [Pyrinomonadaceae bacterium]|nr:hypothetical protein [Pyrinomonadaceae bacterium]